ncbi:MAG: PAS domain S-box protein [Deltaproteobacteria bacterium]|nr:PAS domain S-box protein [Deltaproteobacteria bacterium]MBP6830646.1 PAS domain S-box protein [Deltaproteobacteria bacterium]
MHRRLLDASPLGILVHNKGIVHYANDAIAEITGIPKEELIGRKAASLVAPEDNARVTQRVARRMRGEVAPPEYEVVVRRPDGTRRNVELQLSSIDGDVLVFVRDVTDRAALRIRRFSLSHLGVSVHLLRTEAEVEVGLRVGLGGAELIGVLLQPDGDGLAVRFVEGYEPDRAAVERALGQSLSVQRTAWTPLFHEAWGWGEAFSDDGYAELAALADVPAGALAGEDASVIEALRAVVTRVDGWAGGPALLLLAGRWLREDDVPVARLLSAQVSAALDNVRDLARARRRERELEAVSTLARAMLAEARGGSVPLLRAACEVVAAMMGAREVSAWVLRRGESLRRAAAWPSAEASPIARVRLATAPWVVDLLEQGEVTALGDTRSSPKAAAFWREEGDARSLWFIPFEGQGGVRGAMVVGDNPGRRLRDDEVALARAVASVVRVGLENAELHEEARRRLDALTAAQSRLVQRERLAALGELSAVMAHEVRNPLGVIFNSLGSLDRLLKPSGDAKLLLDIVREESDRLNRIVSDLLDFARPVNLAPRPMPVDRLLDEAWTAAATASSAAPIEVRREIEPGLPMIEADSRLLRQALINVMVNAMQALPHGGSVTLRARASELGHGQPAVDLEVEDTGAGLGNVDLSRVFEPFFTSKATGTGLGLAVVRRIIEEHGGTVSLRPGAHGGAVFSARLPVRSGQVPYNSLATPPDGITVGGGI